MCLGLVPLLCSKNSELSRENVGLSMRLKSILQQKNIHKRSKNILNWELNKKENKMLTKQEKVDREVRS